MRRVNATATPIAIATTTAAIAAGLFTGCASTSGDAPLKSFSTTGEAPGLADRIETGPPRQYEAPRMITPPVIDGRLDDAGWAAAPWTEDFGDIRGPSLPAPRFRTRARIAWDEQYLYVAAELEEPHVWAAMTEHDQIIWHEKNFEVFVDPDGDEELYFEYEINALGTVFDLVLVRTYIAGGPALHEWDWKGARFGIQVDGTLNDPSDIDRGWTVELALPWTPMAPGLGEGGRIPPQPGDTWRINFSRVMWEHDVVDGRYVRRDPPEDNWTWSPQGLINMHLPRFWGFVTFQDRMW
jgi:hypothetical protein